MDYEFMTLFEIQKYWIKEFKKRRNIINWNELWTKQYSNGKWNWVLNYICDFNAWIA